MIGPRMAETVNLFDHFAFERLWSPALRRWSTMCWAPSGESVFVVGYTDDPYQRKMLDWFPPEIGPVRLRSDPCPII